MSVISRLFNAIPTFLWSLVTLLFLAQSIAWTFFPTDIMNLLDSNKTFVVSDGVYITDQKYLLRVVGIFALFGFSASLSLASWNVSRRISLLLTTLGLHLGFVGILVLHVIENPWKNEWGIVYLTFGSIGTALTLLQVLGIIGVALCAPVVKTTTTNSSQSQSKSKSGGGQTVITTSQGGGAILAERQLAALKR